MDKEFKRQTIEILENFDFGRVYDVMTVLNWKYSFPVLGDQIPTVQQLKVHAETMLDFIGSNGIKHLSSGGFLAEKIITNRGSKLALSFEISSYVASPYAK